ncbi:MAG: hypothetical protein JO290_03975 [Sphingomonadaceae bacterium]|nr:hypothetical protein [Sphingomonadaceae bacterium]
MRRAPWLRLLTAILGVAVLAGVAAALLPNDPYQRYATLDHTIQNRVRWIYERVHFDPTPVDIAVIGPSRSGAGISSPRLEADLAAAGHAWHTVNFSLPENGRDLNWVILNELLTTKHPRLIVVGVLEKPSRYGHPAYKYVAPAVAVADPAYVGNLNWLANLIYLPYRQARLALARLMPAAFDLPARFDPAHYAGSNDETTTTFIAGDGTRVERDVSPGAAALAAGKVRYERGVRPPKLGRRLADVEFGDERTYLRRMAAVARAHGVRVAFLFLPYYIGPTELQERALYATIGPVFDAAFVRTHAEWYSDVAHLNHAGAVVVTDWLAPQLVPLMEAPR